MARRLWALACLAHALLNAATPTDAGADEAEEADARPGNPCVRRLHIEGNARLSDAEIGARIATEGQRWGPLSRCHALDEASLAADLSRIERLYRAHGYYEARVTAVRVERISGAKGRPGEADVTIAVDEGPLTRVASREVLGLEALGADERREILDQLPLKVGAPMVEADLDAGKAWLVEALEDRGFALATADESAVVFRAEAEADVTYRVWPGEHFVIGELRVTGLERVREEAVREQARVSLPLGERFSPKSLRAAEIRLADMGVFESVRVARGARQGEGRIAIDIHLREAPFRTIRLGAGIFLDPRRQELPRLWGSWTHRDFLGGLRRFTIDAAFALVLTEQLWETPDRPRPAGALEARLTQPALVGPNLSLDTSLGYERGIVDASLGYDAARARIGLPWRVSGRFTFTPSFNFSLARFHVPDSLESLADEVDQPMALDACARTEGLCRLAYLEQRLVYDRRDSPIFPTRGFWLSLALQEGGRFLGGAYDYLRLMPEARVYVPLGGHVLALRAMFGLVHTLGSATSSVLTRFFLGGASTQRGFGGQALSPRLALARDVRDGQIDEADAIATGGNAMIAANIELRFRLPHNFGLAVFCDAAEVVLDIDDLAADALQIAVGLGVSYRTILGPVRLDFGYRVRAPPLQVEVVGDLGEVALVGLRRFSLLLSLGEAF